LFATGAKIWSTRFFPTFLIWSSNALLLERPQAASEAIAMKRFCGASLRYSASARAPMGAEVLARKKRGTKSSAVRRPSPLPCEMNTAFHSSSFGSIAAASDETMTPVRMRQLSRSTSSCDFLTHCAGSPCVSV
jgi:hypothetical protein